MSDEQPTREWIFPDGYKPSGRFDKMLRSKLAGGTEPPRWPIQQDDGSILWVTWHEIKQHLGTPSNAWDEIQTRLTDLMTRD